MSRSGQTDRGDASNDPEDASDSRRDVDGTAVEGDVLATARGAVGVVHGTSSAVDGDIATIDDLSSSQVSDMQAVSEAVTDLSATTEQLAASAAQMSELSDEAATAADDGLAATAEAAEAMATVEELTETVAADVERLADSVAEIDTLVDVIADIADETNLLALNANIEAARTDGDGFGVVADEIKALADESKAQTDEVEAVVAEITTATDDLTERLATAGEVVADGRARVDDAEAELRTLATTVDEVASGTEQVSSVVDEQAETSERVASRCGETATAAERIDDKTDAIEQRRVRQTEMLAEIDDALETATADRRRQLSAAPDIPTGVDAVDRRYGGFPRGGRGVVAVDADAARTATDDFLASTVAAALADGYGVSLSPTATLDRRTLRDALGDSGVTYSEAVEDDRLFVLDLFDAWSDAENVFGFDDRGLGAVNETVARRCDQPLLVVGNIAGEIDAFGEQATRETTYNNDGGVLVAEDTVVNVVDRESVPAQFADFYVNAADQVVRVGDDGAKVTVAPDETGERPTR